MIGRHVEVFFFKSFLEQNLILDVGSFLFLGGEGLAMVSYGQR